MLNKIDYASNKHSPIIISIDSSDEKLLKMMFAIAKEYNDYEDDQEYKFTDEEI